MCTCMFMCTEYSGMHFRRINLKCGSQESISYCSCLLIRELLKTMSKILIHIQKMLILPNSNDYVHVYFMQMESEEGGEKIKSVDCEEGKKTY